MLLIADQCTLCIEHKVLLQIYIERDIDLVIWCEMCKMESIRKTLRDKKKSTVYILQDFEEREIYPPSMLTYPILHKKFFAGIREAKSGYLDSDFGLPEFFSVNHQGICSSCYPLDNIYFLYIVGFHYGLLHFSWKSFSDEQVLHKIHKNSATKHFLTVSISNCSIKMLMIINHG